MGSLQESTLKMFDKAGFKISVNKRSYFPAVDDDEIEIVMLRAQEMAKYVESGVLDCGIVAVHTLQRLVGPTLQR